MGGWSTARRLLNSCVPRHLGEDLVLSQAGGPGEASVRGVLTRPESIARMGLTQLIAGEARLTLRASDTPAWIGRGTTVLPVATDEEFKVTAVTDNGEGMTEVILCRS